MPQKCLLILLDGLGDRSYRELNNQTPLQAAKTPFLNRLAGGGANGLYHASVCGQALPSEDAHLLMFGYDPTDFPGRGALEALGAGIDLKAGDVAVLAHFASLRKAEDCLFLEENQPSASEHEAAQLFDGMPPVEYRGIAMRLVRTRGLNGILVLKGPASPFVTDSDPFMEGRALVEIKPWHSHFHDPPSRATAAALKQYLVDAFRSLSELPLNLSRKKRGQPPINGIITQRAGRLKKVVPFRQKFGLSGLSIASGIVYQGIAAYLGLDSKQATDTKSPAEDLAARLRHARRALCHYDFIHVHTKAPDAAAHTKDPLAKKAAIEALDSGLRQALGPFLDDPEVLTVITSDHSTPSAGPLVHSGETVPLILHGRGVRQDRVKQFDEISAAAGSLGHMRGRELLLLILNHLDRAKLKGIMDTPADQPFWPGDYEPFTIPAPTLHKQHGQE